MNLIFIRCINKSILGENGSKMKSLRRKSLTRKARGKRQKAKGKRQEARGKRQKAKGKRQEG
ncbi:UNVERIFIED_CONTAM: hypothetical protein BEN50_11205 [Euhalothece sp. KZN 001]